MSRSIGRHPHGDARPSPRTGPLYVGTCHLSQESIALRYSWVCSPRAPHHSARCPPAAFLSAVSTLLPAAPRRPLLLLPPLLAPIPSFVFRPPAGNYLHREIGREEDVHESGLALKLLARLRDAAYAFGLAAFLSFHSSLFSFFILLALSGAIFVCFALRSLALRHDLGCRLTAGPRAGGGSSRSSLSSPRVEVVLLHVHMVVRLARPSCGDGAAFSVARILRGDGGATALLRCAVSIARRPRWRLGRSGRLVVERADIVAAMPTRAGAPSYVVLLPPLADMLQLDMAHRWSAGGMLLCGGGCGGRRAAPRAWLRMLLSSGGSARL
ncbi:hypothetical protein C8J57DRAFT_1503697 [Mycena rebaudengoi]|nr:hypothetical protein C8J57DRAFT_1503697 [Mycena rebaudengoi]